jgi:hypothetical protein
MCQENINAVYAELLSDALIDFKYYEKICKQIRQKYTTYLRLIRLENPLFPDYFEEGTETAQEEEYASFEIIETKLLSI